MKNKLNDNITNAAKKIALRINKPIKNKKFAFLFGSGINNNIAEIKHLNWDSLSKKIIFDFLDLNNEELKNRSKWEKNLLSKEISEEINDNKVSCSFSDKVEIKIHSKPREENLWFQEGFDLIQQIFFYEIIVMTLNYDRVISQNLKEREARNFFLDGSINAKREVLHLHGLVNDKNFVKDEKRILSLEDYVKNSLEFEKKFFKFLCENVEKDFDFTLLIIGTSLKEQHLLNSIYKFCTKYDVEKIKVFWIINKKWNNSILDKYKKIYEKIFIEIININSESQNNSKNQNSSENGNNSENGNTYEEDFKLFWKKLIVEIQKKDFDFEKTKFEEKDIFLDNYWYEILKNKFKNQKSVSIEQILNYIKPKFKLKNLLIRPIYWLEKNDQIVKNGTLKNYVLMQDNSNQFDEIPINQIHWIKDEKFLIKEINLIFEKIENSLKIENDFLNYEIEEFISFHYRKIDFEKYINIHIFLINKILKKEFSKEIEKYILDKTYFSKDLIKRLNKSLYSLELIFYSSKNYFSGENPITQIIENTLEKSRDWLQFQIPQSLEDVFKITQKWRKHHIKPLLFYFFSIEKYKKIIFNDLDFSLNILIKNIKEKNINKNNWLFFTLLCSIFLNSNKEEQFIESLKSRKINNFFDSFPRLIDYFGFSSSTMIPFSKHDGTSIDKNINLNLFNSFEKILNHLKRYNSVSEDEKQVIYEFLYKELNDFSKKDRNLKWIKKLNNIQFSIFFPTISINTPDWETYLEFLTKVDIKLAKWYINIKPPYEIFKRLDYLLEEFDKKDNEKIFEEILLITKIKFVLKRYSTYFLFFDKEIKILLEKVRKKKLDFELKEKTKKLLNQIFSKQFSWLKNIDYEEYLEKLEKREIPERLDELLFIYSFSKNKKISHKINLLIELMKEDLKEENLLKQRIIFDYFLRILEFNIQNLEENSQKIDYFIILINEIKNINNEEKPYWKKHLKSLIIYYELFELLKIKNKEWNQIEIFTSDIIRSFLYYQVNQKNDNLFETNDEKIANYLKEKRFDDKFSKIYVELLNLKENIQHLGKKTLKVLINDIFKDYEEKNESSYSYLLENNEKFIFIKKEIEKYLNK